MILCAYFGILTPTMGEARGLISAAQFWIPATIP